MLVMKGMPRSAKSSAGPVEAGGGSCWNFRAPVGPSRGWHNLMVPHTTFGSDWGSRGVGAWGGVCPIALLPPIPGSFPSPSPSCKGFVPSSKSLPCPVSPQVIPNHGETQTQGFSLPGPVTSTCLPSWTRMRMPVSTILLHLTDQSWKGRYWHFLSKKARSFS